MVGRPGLWSAPPLACEEHCKTSNWGEIWRCMCWTETALWYGLFSYWYNHDSFPYHKELWHARVFEAGIHEGFTFWHPLPSFSVCVRALGPNLLLLLWWFYRKPDLPTWGYVKELVRIFSCVVCLRNLLLSEKQPKQLSLWPMDLLLPYVCSFETSYAPLWYAFSLPLLLRCFILVCSLILSTH